MKPPINLTKSRKSDASNYDIVVHATGAVTCEEHVSDVYPFLPRLTAEVLIDPPRRK
jgi:hypothetical protein